MTNPKVSVIIPAYNSESTIEKCVESVFAQNYNNVECIIVNDGSTDKTDDICQSICNNRNCVKYIKTTNHGVSHARNIGLDNATGDYIVFLDSDDFLLDESISSRVEKMSENALVICGLCEDSLDNSFVIDKNTFADDIQVFLLDLFYMKRYGYQGYSVNKIYSAKIIRDNKIRFSEEIYYNEDRLFVFEYALRCSHVYYVDKVLYCYVQTSDSAMYSVKNDEYNPKQITELSAFMKMLSLAPSKKIKNAIEYDCFRSSCRILRRIPRDKEWKNDRKTVIKLRNKYFWHYLFCVWSFGTIIYKFEMIIRMLYSILQFKRKRKRITV